MAGTITRRAGTPPRLTVEVGSLWEGAFSCSSGGSEVDYSWANRLPKCSSAPMIERCCSRREAER